MSASDKKRLRKEQAGGMLTEKQIAAQKEAKTLKIYTVLFVAVMVLSVVLFAGSMINKAVKNSGYMERKTIAVAADDVDLTTAEFTYYFVDSVNRFYNDLQNYYGEYASMYAQLFYGIQVNVPLNQQENPNGGTWDEYFIDQAKQAVQSNFGLCRAAEAEGFTLSEDGQNTLDTQMTIIGLYAKQAGLKNTDEYLKALYGSGATEETYRAYMAKTSLATEYYNAHKDSLTFSDAELRAAEEGRFNDFSSFSGNYYYISINDYLEGGTEGEDGTVTYSDEEKAAAIEKAESVAKLLTDRKFETVEELDEAIRKMPGNNGRDDGTTAFDDVLYSSMNSIYRQWMADESRQEGDMTYLPVEAENADGEMVTSSYYVVYYRSTNDNTRPLANVRHLLVAFEGEDEDNFTDEEKAAAYAKAEEYLAMFESGDKTEDSFAALVSEHTDDTASASTGGLYENISPASNYVENFVNWAIDPERQTGDTGIVETEYGYHIMYYVGDSDMSYRDSMISEELVTEAQNSWYLGLMETVTVTEKNLSRIDRALVIRNESESN